MVKGAQLMQQNISKKYNIIGLVNLLMHQVKEKKGIIRQLPKACFYFTKYSVQIFDESFKTMNLLKIQSKHSYPSSTSILKAPDSATESNPSMDHPI